MRAVFQKKRQLGTLRIGCNLEINDGALNLQSLSESEGSIKAGVAQLVEHDLAKVGVASSSLVSRSVSLDT